MIRILATTDLHMHLLPWDYYTDKPSLVRGLSLLAGMIAKARAEVPHCLLVDNGDFLQGSPLGDYLAETAIFTDPTLHPMIAALNQLSYDAVCVGNHEFSHGLDFLQDAVADAKFPVLSANILRELGPDPGSDSHLFAPTALIERWIHLPDQQSRLLKIGLVGLTPDQILQWENETLAGRIQVRGMFEAAAFHLADLRRRGADIVIALAHSGLGDPSGQPDQENAVIRLAKHLNFDAIIAGHTHQTFPNDMFGQTEGMDAEKGLIHGTPTVMAGFYGSHLGVIDLQIAPLDPGGWRVAGAKVSLRAVFRRSPSGAVTAAARQDPAIRAIAAKSHAQTRRWARRRIGETKVPLDSFFALIGPSASVRLVAQAQADHVRQAVRGSVWDGLPVLSAAAPFRTGGRSGPENYTHIPPGPLTLRNIADLYTFPNSIVALMLSGAEVHDWLERAAAQFNRIPRGARDAELINPDMPGFDFDLVHGLDYQIDLSRPPMFDPTGHQITEGPGRVTNLRHNGAEVDPKARFVFATNSYRSGGGGGYAVANPAKVILRGGQSIRTILTSYVARLGCIEVEQTPNWRFSPMKDTSVTFLSSPLAACANAGLPSGMLEPLERLENGFQRFRLTLG